MWKAQNCNCLAYFCDLKNKHRRLTLFLFSKFIHPVSFVIFFYHCTSSFGLSPQATMTKKSSEDQKLFYCGLQQILQCSCCFWRPLWTKFMRKYQEYLIPSVTDGVTKTRICWVNLAVGPQQPLSSKQVWIHDIFTFSPKVMGLYNKEDYLTCCDSVQKLTLFCSFALITTLSYCYCSVFAFQNSQVDFKALY